MGTLISEKCHWAQVLVPVTVYLILATVYWHLWYWVLQFIGSLGHYFTPAASIWSLTCLLLTNLHLIKVEQTLLHLINTLWPGATKFCSIQAWFENWFHAGVQSSDQFISWLSSDLRFVWFKLVLIIRSNWFLDLQKERERYDGVQCVQGKPSHPLHWLPCCKLLW